MCRRHIGLELLVLPAVRAGKEFMAQLPHSRGAKRRENAAVRGAFLSDSLDGVVGLIVPSFPLPYSAFQLPLQGQCCIKPGLKSEGKQQMLSDQRTEVESSRFFRKIC
jgi:hypothetical protein